MPHPYLNDMSPPVQSVAGPDGVLIEVWFDPQPGARAVIVEVEAWGQELHLPVEVARAVAEAIGRALSPLARPRIA